MALDFAPLVAFFVAYKVGGVYWATGIIIALTILSLIIGYVVTGKLAKFPLFSGILITVMGGLTLYLHNDMFVKMKPTAANLIFAGLFLGGGSIDQSHVPERPAGLSNRNANNPRGAH